MLQALSFQGFVRLIASQLTPIQAKLGMALARLRDAFRIFDADGGGTVEYDEFLDASEHAFGCTDRRRALRVVQSLDPDQNGWIDFTGFVALMGFEASELRDHLHRELDSYSQLFALFAVGEKIEVANLVSTWEALGLGPVPEAVAELAGGGAREMGFAEFVGWIVERAKGVELAAITELTDMWGLLDCDGDGAISLQEISAVLVKFGLEAEAAEHIAHVMLEQAGETSLVFQSFVQLLAKTDRSGQSTSGAQPYGLTPGAELSFVKQHLQGGEHAGKDLRAVRRRKRGIQEEARDDQDHFHQIERIWRQIATATGPPNNELVEEVAKKLDLFRRCL